LQPPPDPFLPATFSVLLGKINTGEKRVIRQRHRVWSAGSIVEVFSKVAGSAHDASTSHVLILSDDDALVRNVLSLASSASNGKLRILHNGALGHAKQGQDCIRELDVGCDKTLSESVIAESIVFDFLLGASGTHMIGSFNSGFSSAIVSILYPWQISSSPPGVGASGQTVPLIVNLDEMDPAFPSKLEFVES
jgi:hypothetical protein